MSAPNRPRGEPLRADAVIRRLAATQHGVVARSQLLEAGLTARQIRYRAHAGQLARLHRGVYRAGVVAAPLEREMAAVLACGGAAVLSHRSAAATWRQLPPLAATAVVEVSVRGGYRVPGGGGVRAHRVAWLERDEVTAWEGVPITTPARTLLDLASTLDVRTLEQAVARAERDGGVQRGELERLLVRHARRAGSRKLRALIASGATAVFVRSEAEARFLGLLRKAGLRAPEVNVVVHGFEVDFLWRVERLVVEIDGFAYHASREAFERDRRRDALLTAAGLRVLRVTWRQLVHEPERVLARVVEALARSHAP